MKKYPRQSKNVFELTAAQNASMATADKQGRPAPQPQMAGAQRIGDQGDQNFIKQADDAMRRENVKRKNPLIAAQLDAIDKLGDEGAANKIRSMFPKSKRQAKERTRWKED